MRKIMEIHKEDALQWALKTASAGVPVPDVLADASMIEDWFGVKLAPVEQAIVTVQRFRDRIPADTPPTTPVDAGGLDEFLADLIQDLRDPIVEVEIVGEESVGSDRIVEYIQSMIPEHEGRLRVFSSQHVVSLLNSIIGEIRLRRVDWGEAALFTEMQAERDRARDTAVQLEQELAQSEAKFAAAEQQIDKNNDHLVKGVLLEAKRRATNIGSPIASTVVNDTATQFGVTL